jgi:7-cyano-7-deazaguanine synthase in queuosine biosynthesis
MNRVTDQGIWIESDVSLASAADWTIPLRLMWAVSEGQPANLGSASPLLAGNLETLRDIYVSWTGGHQIPITYEISSDVTAPASGVSLFFSGGVDSCYSLIKHRDEIDNLVLVHGFDVPLADTKTFALVEAQAREVARLFGKRLIVVRTNMRWERPSVLPMTNLRWEWPHVPCGWFMCHGAAMASVAHALAPNHGKIYIASSHSYADLHPWGSHPLLDPLWSSETVQIIHDGGELRIDKLRAVVHYPEVLARLRVCTESLGSDNCGLCEKCVRTMLGLRAMGVDRCDAFPTTLTPELVSRQALNNDSVLHWRELQRASLPPDLHAAVQAAIQNYDTGLPVRTGKWKREVKRWLYAARNAGRALMAPIDRF